MLEPNIKNQRWFKPGEMVVRAALWVGILSPALFLFFAIQYSAITVPFWDHVELGRTLIRIHDTGFHWSYLWEPHNHSRPMTYRAVLLWNAWLTNWDIRSEYIYLIASIYGAFLLHALTLRRVVERTSWLRFTAVLFVLSILYFSPAGHNNHWWSMMIHLDFANLFILAALILVAFNPESWWNTFLSAAACWLATYSISNGLVVSVAVALVAQASQAQPLRANRRSIFWLVNTVVLFTVYLYGLPGAEITNKASPLVWLEFVLVYLGTPAGAMIEFPYRSARGLPPDIWFNMVTGIAVLAGVGMMAYLHRKQLRQRTKGALLFMGFTLFALGSAAVTAWGRAAVDEYGIANANASQFTVFSSYMLFGILYLIAAHPLQIQIRHVGWAEALLFIGVLAGRTYAHSVAVYQDAHQLNQIVSMAYVANQTEQDMFVYPNPAVVAELKTGLKRLQLGPYRVPLPEAAPTTSTPLRELSQNLLEDAFHVNGIRTDPNLGEILFAHPSSRFALPLAPGAIAIDVDFGIYDTAMVVLPPTDGVEFRISLTTSAGETLLWSRALHPVIKPADRGSQHLKLPLPSSKSGQLVFGTRPGAASENDWAYWANLSVTRQ